MIPVILTSLVSRHEKRGLQGGNVLNGLQKLLNHNAKSGWLSDKKMSEVLKILMFDVAPEQCARLMKALDPTNNKSALVEDVIEVFKSELIKLPKPTVPTVSSPPKRRTTGHGTSKVGETQHSVDDLGASVEGPVRPKAERPSSAVDKTARTSNAAPAVGALHSKSSGNVLANEGKTAAAAGEIDWSKEPLPEGWERKRLAKNNKLVYVNKQLEEIRWQHPNDPSKPKPKKPKSGASDGKESLNKTADTGSIARKAAAAVAAAAEGEEEEGESTVVDKAKTLPLPKKVTMTAAAAAEKDDGEDADDEV